MKLKQIILIILGVTMVMSTSCFTITGTLVDEAGRNRDVKAAGIPLLEADGWIEPANTDYMLDLTLKSDKLVLGRYLGKDYQWDGNQTVELVLIGNKNKSQIVAINDIKKTKIYAQPKLSPRIGLAIGAVIDFVVIASILLENSELEGSWILNN